MEFQQHVSLAPFTTFEIGGPARWFAEATTEADIEAAGAGNKRPRRIVTVSMEIQGMRSVAKLAAKLGEISGVVSVNVGDENSGGD